MDRTWLYIPSGRSNAAATPVDPDAFAIDIRRGGTLAPTERRTPDFGAA